jgi:hypothetical protein
MNKNAAARLYHELRPLERLALIMAAEVRGDEADEARLRASSLHITLNTRDYQPFAAAFSELSHLFYIELQALICDYRETWDLANAIERDAAGTSDPEGERERHTDDDVASMTDSSAQSSVTADAGANEADGRAHEPSLAERTVRLACALGFVFKTKVSGWTLFCGEWKLPPFANWKLLPGYVRFEQTLREVENCEPEDLLSFLNCRRPKGEPSATTLELSPQTVAAQLGEIFKERAAWWGGKLGS